jgi:hypothetical protein
MPARRSRWISPLVISRNGSQRSRIIATQPRGDRRPGAASSQP